MKTENLTDRDIQEATEIDNNFKVKVGNLLEDKVVIITGYYSGLGAAMTKVFLEAGAKIVGCYFSEADERLYPSAIKDVKKFSENSGYSRNFIASNFDIANEKTPEKLVKNAINNFGKIDILCNFAGIAYFSKFEDMTRENYDRTLAVNLTGAVFLTQKVAEEMKKTNYNTKALQRVQ